MGKYHDKGEQDAAKGYGNYNPPHSSIAERLSGFLTSDKELAQQREDKEQYDKGYENGKKQR